MPILDTQYSETNQELLNTVSLALTAADSYTNRIAENLETVPLTDLRDISLESPEFGLNEPSPTDFDTSTTGGGSFSQVGGNAAGGSLSTWLNTFFPALTNDFNTIPEDWLMGVLTGAYPLGMEEKVFRRVWQRARDREETQRMADVNQARASLSQRGFKVPPGALIAAVDRAQGRASAAVQEVNREETIREEELKTKMLQFAAEQAASLRQGLTASVAEFLRVFKEAEADTKIEEARLKLQGQAEFYNALKSYHDVEARFAELEFRAQEIQTNSDLEQQKNEIQHNRTQYESARALADAIRGLSDIAASSSSAAGTLLAQIEGV